jgi:hypothetical protein
LSILRLEHPDTKKDQCPGEENIRKTERGHPCLIRIIRLKILVVVNIEQYEPHTDQKVQKAYPKRLKKYDPTHRKEHKVEIGIIGSTEKYGHSADEHERGPYGKMKGKDILAPIHQNE